MTPSLAQRVSDELLPRVKQPAQYIGGEFNQLVKPGDWAAAELRVAIAFPDTYAIGMSHLGCQILYWLCNHTPGVCAERVFAPWTDAEAVMRERKIPLFTWDTRQPAAEADIFAISLQYEMCFTSVLNLLDLAGIPLTHAERNNGGPVSDRSFQFESQSDVRSPASPVEPVCEKDRSETGPPRPRKDWPLVIVGGPQADNPEPMADFVDLVVLGDGEHSMAAILEAVREYKREGVSRPEMILRLARRFSWIYAPNLYEISYHADGTIAGMFPKHDGLPTRIERCKTPDFDAVPFPTRPIVPWIPVVHDRIGIEIMRGCPQVCRFCHAGYTKRPLTLRSVDRILEIAEEAYWATGQHEIGLLSLSTADYPYLKDLAARFNERFGPRHVNMSFPSLRIDKMLQHIPWMGSAVRKGSITMAVEAAKDDMRAAIRKKVTDGNLLDGVREVYKAGWNRVKLYFMSGFPGERDEDIYGIWEVANAVSLARRDTGRPPADVNASVGWLVPKPFTPLQWMAQPRVEYFLSVRDKLRGLSRPGRRGAPVVVDGGAGGYGSTAAMMAENDDSRGGPVSDRSSTRPGTHPDGLSAPLDSSPRKDRPEAGPPFASRAHVGGRWNGRKSAVKITTHDPRRSILEGVMARGDRRLGPAILEAFRRGARLDAWDECYRDDIWQAAFAATGIDPAWYAHRERSFDEILPWDHIGLHMRRGYLEESYDGMFETIHVSKPAAGVTSLPIAR
ncbi:MAG: radical SAM protein [Phycisphaerales bacterium]|nr:radical SAM protein [Phycisphaerales bacterium]